MISDAALHCFATTKFALEGSVPKLPPTMSGSHKYHVLEYSFLEFLLERNQLNAL